MDEPFELAIKDLEMIQNEMQRHLDKRSKLIGICATVLIALIALSGKGIIPKEANLMFVFYIIGSTLTIEREKMKLRSMKGLFCQQEESLNKMLRRYILECGNTITA